MVFLALTSEGLRETPALASQNKCAVWCTNAAIYEQEFTGLCGPAITQFDYSFSLSELGALTQALANIGEHPRERLWLEGGYDIYLSAPSDPKRYSFMVLSSHGCAAFSVT